MGKPRPAKTPAMTVEMAGMPSGGLDSTSQALRQMEATLQGHTSQFKKVLQAILDTKTTLEMKIDAVTLDVNLLRTDHRALVERVAEMEGRRGRQARSENKPTKAQSAEERTRLLREATQFVSIPYLALNALTDAEAETNQADSSDTGDSHQGPLLTPRSADDI
ncbi:hypothetical protein NDU88_002131 [Pleurodeles waltl]|uniref:Uncharacterized protein n=1 Tax=Pleurodeles waltl TaxID=8319 RepID=A0AAV7W363_PLEWA|nr:hypothetical protein NDU88_002131 [Pleurodeles waltl]